MRFLGDMGVSQRVIEWLRAEGHEAIHLRDAGLQRLPDPEVLAMARVEERILLTMDLDFGHLLAASRGTVPAVITFRLEDESAESVIPRLAAVLANYGSQLTASVMVTVTETAIRIRPLPL